LEGEGDTARDWRAEARKEKQPLRLALWSCYLCGLVNLSPHGGNLSMWILVGEWCTWVSTQCFLALSWEVLSRGGHFPFPFQPSTQVARQASWPASQQQGDAYAGTWKWSQEAKG
jgi:hypothetical protein